MWVSTQLGQPFRSKLHETLMPVTFSVLHIQNIWQCLLAKGLNSTKTQSWEEFTAQNVVNVVWPLGYTSLANQTWVLTNLTNESFQLFVKILSCCVLCCNQTNAKLMVLADPETQKKIKLGRGSIFLKDRVWLVIRAHIYKSKIWAE